MKQNYYYGLEIRKSPVFKHQEEVGGGPEEGWFLMLDKGGVLC